MTSSYKRHDRVEVRLGSDEQWLPATVVLVLDQGISVRLDDGREPELLSYDNVRPSR